MTLAVPARTPTAERIGAPFKGLTYFTEDDSEIFFGRNAERVLIATTLLATRFTVVYGESGVGKSSLLRAGAVHDLRERALRERAERRAGGGSRRARFIPVVISDWRDDPLVASDEAIRLAATQGLVDGPLPGPFAGTQFDALLESWCTSTGATLLIVLDQFEEYLLYHTPDGDEDLVGAGLARAIARRDLSVRFIVSIREDALAKLDRYEGRIPNVFENFIRVEHLDKQAGEEAIRGPIDRYNAGLDPDEQRIDIEDKLVERVLSQIERSEPGIAGDGSRRGRDARVETAFLQLVMERLWNEEREADSNILRAATFDRLGGAKKIVRAHLGDAMNELTDEEQAIAAKAFGRLVTPSRQKIAYLPSDLAAAENIAPAEMRTVLERLTEHRILRPVAPPPGLEEPRYEIFHDVLADPVLAWRARYDEGQALRRAEEQQAKRQRELTKRLRRRLALALALALGFAALSAWAIHQSGVASNQRAIAQANAQAFRAGALLDSNPAGSVKTAATALRTARTGEAEDALRSALGAALARHAVVLRGHHGGVVTARFSHDGTRVVTASSDGTARVWQASTGRSLVVLRPQHPVALSAADLSADGDRVVTAGHDGSARIWQVPSGRLLTVLRRQAGPVTDARFSPDSTLVVTAGRDGTARIWQVTTGHLVATLRGHKGAVNAASFSPDGRLIVTAGEDGTARIWRTASGRSIKTLHIPAAVSTAAFSPDGTEVVTASRDQFARIWQLKSARTLVKLRDRNTPAFASLSPDGMLVITAGAGGTAQIWQVSNTRQPLMTLRGGYIQGADFSPDGTRVVTANTASVARVWDVSGNVGQSVRFAPAGDASISAASFTADGKRLALGTLDGSVKISRVADGTRLETLRAGSAPVLGLAFGAGGKQILVLSAGGSVHVFDTATGKVLPLLRDLRAQPNAVAFSPDGKRVVTAGADGAVRTFDTVNGHQLHVLQAGKEPISAVSVSSDGRRTAVGRANDGQLFEAGGRLTLAELRRASISAVAFDPTGDLVATGSDDGTARIWGRTGRSLAVLSGHAGTVLAIAFSHSATRVFTAGTDGTVRTYTCAFCGGVDDLLRRADRY